MKRTSRLLGGSLILVISAAGALAHLAANGSAITGTVTAKGFPSSADAVVFLEEAAGTPPAAPLQMDQRNFQFAPHVLPVIAGTTVKFLNSDNQPHNVFSPDHEKYNLGTWPQGQTKSYTFNKCQKFPCAYVQLCRVHPEMEGYVVVVPNAYFAVTGKDGHFTINGVPPGPHTVSAWHPKLKAKPISVTVEAAKPAVVDIVLSR